MTFLEFNPRIQFMCGKGRERASAVNNKAVKIVEPVLERNVK